MRALMGVRSLPVFGKATPALIIALLALMISPSIVVADGTNPGVVPTQAHPYGMSYGQWSAKWWQWAFMRTDFNRCPGESGPVFFLSAPAQSSCTVPRGTSIMFPFFNAEWSVAEANGTLRDTAGNSSCVVPVTLNGTSDAALQACATALANHGTDSDATLEADVDGVTLQNPRHYRAVSPPFDFTAVAGNPIVCQPPPTGTSCPFTSHAVADGFWIMLTPQTP